MSCAEVGKWESQLTIEPLPREHWKGLAGAGERKHKVAHREESTVQGINTVVHGEWWMKQRPPLGPAFPLELRFCWSQPCPGLTTSRRTRVPQGTLEGVRSYY